jgi:hypothetical protein
MKFSSSSIACIIAACIFPKGVKSDGTAVWTTFGESFGVHTTTFDGALDNVYTSCSTYEPEDLEPGDFRELTSAECEAYTHNDNINRGYFGDNIKTFADNCVGNDSNCICGMDMWTNVYQYALPGEIANDGESGFGKMHAKVCVKSDFQLSQYIGGGGDPHFITYVANLTWQAECDFKMIESKRAANGIHDVLVHARTTKKQHYSFIEQAAIRIGHDVWEFNAKDAGSVLLNGKEHSHQHAADANTSSILVAESAESVHTAESYTLTTSYKGKNKLIAVHDIDLGNGKTIKVRCNLHYHMLFLDLKGAFPQKTDGLLGTPYASTLFTRDGVAAMPETEEEVNAYGESWQIRDTDPKLFQVDRYPQYPQKCEYAPASSTSTSSTKQLRGRRKLLEEEEDVTKISVDDATAACAKHHGSMKKFCIDDVIAIGDLSIADEEFYSN